MSRDDSVSSTDPTQVEQREMFELLPGIPNVSSSSSSTSSIESTDNIDMKDMKILDAVCQFYNEEKKKGTHLHKAVFGKKACVIAALVLQKPENEYKPVIVCTGTKFKLDCVPTIDQSNYWHVCDGHAEAMCYRLVPLYMLSEIRKLEQKEESIIFKNSTNEYKLKENVKFHLFISHSPCGFMTENIPSDFVSWKLFGKVPHVLQCSSKILIASFLGIQGPLCCILSEPVYVSSIIIFREGDDTSNDVEAQRIEGYFTKFLDAVKKSSQKSQSRISYCGQQPKVKVIKMADYKKTFEGLDFEIPNEKKPNTIHYVVSPNIKHSFKMGQDILPSDISFPQIEFTLTPEEKRTKLEHFQEATCIVSEVLQLNATLHAVKDDSIKRFLGVLKNDYESVFTKFNTTILNAIEHKTIIHTSTIANKYLNTQSKPTTTTADAKTHWEAYMKYIDDFTRHVSENTTKFFGYYELLNGEGELSLTKIDCDWAFYELKMKDFCSPDCKSITLCRRN